MTDFSYVNRDEILKNKLLTYGPHLTVSVYQPWTGKKNRRNTKRARLLESIIIENSFTYKKFSHEINKFEIQYFFVIYGDLEKFREIMEKNSHYFKTINYYENLEEILQGVTFEHPITACQKRIFNNRKEIYADSFYQAPNCIGHWIFKKSDSEGRYIYEYRNYIGIISWKEELQSFIINIGSIRPVGFQKYKGEARTISEAIEFLREH